MPRRFGQNLTDEGGSDEPSTQLGLPGLGESPSQPVSRKQPDAQTAFVGNSGFGAGVSAGLGAADLSRDPGQDSLAPSLELPKGGGALRGIGETFDVNAFTGSGSLQIPIVSSPSRGGGGPQLGLSYSSGAGQGVFGLGMQLSPPSITRRTDRGLPTYDDETDRDTFVLSGAEHLVPRLDDSGVPLRREETRDGTDYVVHTYRPRVEGGFSRIERWVPRDAAGLGPAMWRVTSSGNVVSTFGETAAGRIADPDDPRRVFTWLLERVEDDRGNIARYTYQAEDTQGVDTTDPAERRRRHDALPQRYLKRVVYGNAQPFVADGFVFEVVFDYGEHGALPPADVEHVEVDVTAEARRPWAVRPDPFSTYRSRFDLRRYRRCQRVLVVHRFAALHGGAATVVASTDLHYDDDPVGSKLVAVVQRGYIRDAGNPSRYATRAGPPLRLTYQDRSVGTSLHDGGVGHGLRAGVDADTMQLVDLDADGLPGILHTVGGSWMYQKPLGEGRFAPPQPQPSLPSPARGRGLQLLDLDGDGRRAATFTQGSVRGSSRRHDDGTWGLLVPFDQVPNTDLGGARTRSVDVTGDGLADVVVDLGERLRIYPSRGRRGHASALEVPKPGDELDRPRTVYTSPQILVSFADMSGDGLADLVIVENGSVRYWPNLGWGRFGPSVTMGGLRPFDDPASFRASRVRLADVDGSGTADLVLFDAEGAVVWFNAAGNRFVEETRIEGFPPVDDVTHAEVQDLTGTGTSDLVWSSSWPSAKGQHLRYLPLFPHGKPYLLTEVDNGVGLRTRLRYAPSTRFSLADHAAGRPWKTRLPFPVQVLEQVERHDAVTGFRWTSSYRYRHGYFDAVEREFRGFARVDQQDVEQFEAGEDSLDVPPAHTRTWFHTGAPGALEGMHEEFWVVPGTTPLVDPVIAPSLASDAAMTSDEYLEALRALRGQAVRQEVYSLDGSEAQERPYAVTETQSAVRLEQPRRRDQAYEDSRAVVFVHPAQTRTWHVERAPDDPRLQQSLTLEVDAYGVAIRSAALGYPRRAPEHAEQGQSAIVVTEVDVLHLGDDDLRLGIPVEQRAFALQGLGLDADAPLSADALREALDGAATLPFEADTALPGLRALSRRQALYWNDALTAPLPLGTVGTRTLLHSQQSARFTDAQAQAVFGEVLDDETLADVLTEGRYVQDGPSWWSRSGHAVPDPAQFYLPTRFVSPFGHETTVTYDAARQHVVSTVDALGNTVSAEVDYRVLSPRRVTDPNGTTARVRFDALGQVVVSAIAGRDGEGDTLDDPTATFSVDLWAFVREGRPTSVHTRSRERHADPGTRWLEQWVHVDGLGNVAQSKAMAEPGLAPQRDASGDLVLDEDGNVVQVHAPSRWVGSGRVIRNNKGLAVKQYEPFFSDRPDYEEEAVLVQTGVTPVMHYDPMGRVVRTDLPDGSFARVEFSPWWSRSFDPGDTVLESAWYAARIGGALGPQARRAAALSELYADTPSTVHHDHLGRAFLSVAHNRWVERDSGETRESFSETRASLDVEGNVLRVVDARGNVAQENTVGPGGVVLRTASVDAGDRWALAAVDGAPLRSWNSRGIRARARFDALRRPTHQFVREASGGEMLVTRTVYGESMGSPETTYHRGQVYRVYDGAGVATQVAYDFEGNAVRQSRALAAAYEDTVDWSALAELEDVADLEAAAAPLLESEVFEAEASFDALGRPVTQTTPDGTAIHLAYNEAALLEGVRANVRGSANETSFVSNIDYDVKGRRSLIAYGNGTQTAYTYDEVTQRLTRLRTIGDTRTFQDLAYTYDAVGNIVEIADAAQADVYFDGAVVTARQRYEYDALYRLVHAEGREHIGQNAAQPTEFGASPSAHPQDGTAMRTYAEQYAYDVVGNILSMQHAASGGNWTRAYQYADSGNRLVANSAPGDASGVYSHSYGYDAHGNMTAMPHLSAVTWNYADQMRSADLGGGGTAYFVYDASGQRVRKVRVNLAGTQTYERIYLGAYELYRERTSGALQLERETLHIADDGGRMCDLETRTVESGAVVSTPTTHHRYQYSNHLGSACLELTGAAEVISYEEYHPYGTSAYRAVNSSIDVSVRRYRYTGKERDEETGLGYHGARYYACWLGRWTASDPIGLGDGVNRYAYVSGRPIVLVDPNGEGGTPHPRDYAGPTSVEEGSGSTPAAPAVAPSTASLNADTFVDGLPTDRKRFLSDVDDVGKEVELPGIRVDKFDKNNDVGGSTVKSLGRFASENVYGHFRNAREARGTVVFSDVDAVLAESGASSIDLDLAFVIAVREAGQRNFRVRGTVDTFDFGGLDNLFRERARLRNEELIPPEFVEKGQISMGRRKGAEIPVRRMLAFTFATVGLSRIRVEESIAAEYFPGDPDAMSKASAMLSGADPLAQKILVAFAFARPYGGTRFSHESKVPKPSAAGIRTILRALHVANLDLDDVKRLPSASRRARASATSDEQKEAAVFLKRLSTFFTFNKAVKVAVVAETVSRKRP